MYRNQEGYYDPTAGIAVRRCYAKERSDKRKAQRKKNHQERVRPSQNNKGKAKIYVCSPYAGNVSGNRAAAIRACRYVTGKGKIPVASHLRYPQVSDEGNPDERETGLVYGRELLSRCDEVWVFGKAISSGMEREIGEAKKLGKKIRYIEEVS